MDNFYSFDVYVSIFSQILYLYTRYIQYNNIKIIILS